LVFRQPRAISGRSERNPGRAAVEVDPESSLRQPVKTTVQKY